MLLVVSLDAKEPKLSADTSPTCASLRGALGCIYVWHDNGIISLNKSTKPHSHPLLINCSAAVETQLNSTDLGIMCAEPPHRL